MHDKLFTLKKGVGHYSALKLAPKYSLFNLAMFDIEISLGQVASQAPVLVQDPNPSLSICATIFNTRDFLSGAPCGNNAKWETLALRNNIAELFLQAATHAPHPIHIAAANTCEKNNMHFGAKTDKVHLC